MNGAQRAAALEAISFLAGVGLAALGALGLAAAILIALAVH